MLLCPIHYVIVDEPGRFEQILKHTLYPHVIWFLLELKSFDIIEVLLEFVFSYNEMYLAILRIGSLKRLKPFVPWCLDLLFIANRHLKHHPMEEPLSKSISLGSLVILSHLFLMFLSLVKKILFPIWECMLLNLKLFLSGCGSLPIK